MTRVAVVSARDSADPANASGTAYGLTQALEAMGIEVIRVHAGLPQAAWRPVTAVTVGRWRAESAARRSDRPAGAPQLGIETVLVRHGIQRLRMRKLAVDGVIQLSSDFLLRVDAPYATYEDMTIRQALSAGYTAWQLPPRDLSWRVERQRLGYERATACCTRSAWAARSIRDEYGIDADRVKVVGVGPNHETSPVERVWDPPRFLFVASDWERKNGPMLLAAFERLRSQIPGARLDIVGRHPSLDVPGVHGHGYLSLRDPAQATHLRDLFNRATCLVLPSLHEPLGISHVEAAAAGIPSIGSAAGGAREVIGAGGRVVDPTSPEDLFQAMQELADPEHAHEAGQRALTRANLYTWPLVAARMLAVLGIRAPAAETVEFLDGPDKT